MAGLAQLGFKAGAGLMQGAREQWEAVQRRGREKEIYDDIYGFGMDDYENYKKTGGEQYPFSQEALQDYQGSSSGSDGNTDDGIASNMVNAANRAKASGFNYEATGPNSFSNRFLAEQNGGYNGQETGDPNSWHNVQLMNLKNQYEQAQNLGDNYWMQKHLAEAERIRQDANEKGVPLMSYLQDGSTDTYGTALNKLQALRANGGGAVQNAQATPMQNMLAQNAGNNQYGFSMSDFNAYKQGQVAPFSMQALQQYQMDGNGNGNFSWQNFNKQLQSPGNSWASSNASPVVQGAENGVGLPTTAEAVGKQNSPYVGMDYQKKNSNNGDEVASEQEQKRQRGELPSMLDPDYENKLRAYLYSRGHYKADVDNVLKEMNLPSVIADTRTQYYTNAYPQMTDGVQKEMALGQLAATNPAVANLYTNRNVSAKDQWLKEQEVNKENRSNNEWQRRADYELKNKKDYINFKNEAELKNAVDKAKLADELSKQAMQSEFEMLTQNGMPPKEAQERVMAKFMGGGYGSSKSSKSSSSRASTASGDGEPKLTKDNTDLYGNYLPYHADMNADIREMQKGLDQLLTVIEGITPRQGEEDTRYDASGNEIAGGELLDKVTKLWEQYAPRLLADGLMSKAAYNEQMLLFNKYARLRQEKAGYKVPDEWVGNVDK